METERKAKIKRLIFSIIDEKIPKEFSQLGMNDVEDLVRSWFSGDPRIRHELRAEEFHSVLRLLIASGEIFQVGGYWLRRGITKHSYERSPSFAL
ncbi:MAG: hypothetical protein AAB796_01315 [Patescibacteria group bacterium]